MSFTRPDIAYAVQQACLFMHDPRVQHMNALKRIIRYLQGTKDQGIQIYKSNIDTRTLTGPAALTRDAPPPGTVSTSAKT